jgi:FkbM family methyltransferase
MLAESFRRFLSWHASTRKPLSDTIYRFSRRYVLAWSNIENDLTSNGERWLLDRVLAGRTTKQPVVFDVGANIGDWSEMVTPRLPAVRLLAFEPVPPVRKHLADRLAGTKTEIYPYALSDAAGSVTINFTPDNPHLSSLVSMDGASTIPVTSVEVERRTGDGLCTELGIDHIRFLKVDTEGHDISVLRGFTGMIEMGRIDIIQFEYNYMSIYSRTFLRDFYTMLTPAMRIGRLLPDRVEFTEYAPAMDNFIQSNWIAVRNDLVADIASLVGVNASLTERPGQRSRR